MYILGFLSFPLAWQRSVSWPRSRGCKWSLALLPSRLLNLQHFSHEGGGSAFVRNMDIRLQDHTMSRPIWPQHYQNCLPLMHLPMQFYSRHDVAFPWVWTEFQKFSGWDIKADGVIDFFNRDRWNRGSAYLFPLPLFRARKNRLASALGLRLKEMLVIKVLRSLLREIPRMIYWLLGLQSAALHWFCMVFNKSNTSNANVRYITTLIP